ncbi:MAG TPA: anthranilate phosphoribosyltransferase [Thermoplasmata archaeon]|nr:anthranilate phosphoribosyltransferase [Thermoplasmata archaeon]
MIAAVLRALLGPAPLSASDARGAFDRLVASDGSDAERSAVLTALASRRVTVEELALFAGEMRRHATPFPVPRGDAPIDLCGSGGAPRPTYNVSTVSAFVVAAAGVPVVKHGNRSARGPCGSSDLLGSLGLPVTTSRPFSRASYRAHRLAFLHAPLYHPATAAVASVRRMLGIPTVFNRLGPLSNPARVAFQVVGAPGRADAETFARTLARLGVRRGLSMTSEEGCDEFSPTRPTTMILWTGSRVERRTVHPERLLEADERQGSWGPLPPEEAAGEAERILAGGGGARRGSILLTSGAALWISGRAHGLTEGVRRAREALDDGGAEALLEAMQKLALRYRAEGDA